MSADDIDNLRDRLLLSVKHEQQDKVQKLELFEVLMDLVMKISLCRLEYYLEGGRRTLDDKLRYPGTTSVEELEEVLRDWEERCQDWREDVIEDRRRFPCLNFFTTNQILSLHELLTNIHDGASISKLHAICLFALPQLARENLENVLKYDEGWKKEVRDEFTCTGTFLRKLFALCPEQPHRVNSGNSQVVHGDPNLFITDHPLKCCLKLYLERDAMPSAEQVIICSPDTTAEEIHCLMLRCLDASRTEDANFTRFYTKLHVLCGIEHLSEPVQDRLVVLLRKWFISPDAKKSNQNLEYAFAIISKENKKNQNRICQMLGSLDYRREPVVMRSVEMRQMYKKKWRKNHLDFEQKMSDNYEVATPLVRVFWSEKAGVGKTYCIEKRADEHCDGEKIRIPINGPVNVGFIIDQLNGPHVYGQERIVHINIASSADFRINSVLFELLILGHLSTVTGKRYSSKTTDAFMIELPTNISIIDDDLGRDTVEDRFYLCSKPGDMPNYFREEVNPENNILDVNPATEKGRRVQYVLKWLRAFKNGQLRPQSESDPDFDPGEDADFDPNVRAGDDSWRTLLLYYCPQAGESMILASSFINYLHTQLKNCLGVGVHLKQVVVYSLIEYAKDLSSRCCISNRWKESDVPLFVFNQSDTALHTGQGDVSVICYDESKLTTMQTPDLQDIMERMIKSQKGAFIDFQAEEDFRKRIIQPGGDIGGEIGEKGRFEKYSLLSRIFGTAVGGEMEQKITQTMLMERLEKKGFGNYALTYDNILKMLGIYFRVKAGNPVVIVGETGCGKTALVKFLCEFLGYHLDLHDVHRGYTEKMIIERMDESVEIAKRGETVWVFFDEINTCEHLGLFREILCDRSYNGIRLPKNLKVLAACNPYRRRKNDDGELQLVYRVHPLPETMKEYVWNFGTLSSVDERQYINEMIKKELSATTFEGIRTTFPGELESIRTVFVDFLVKSQDFLREKNKGEVSVVSLRDVARCLKLFSWFTERYPKPQRSYYRGGWNRSYVQKQLQSSMRLSLAHCYYYRCSINNRKDYAYLVDRTRSRFNSGRFEDIIENEQNRYLKSILKRLPNGIAMNKLLRENLFMILVCVMSKTPLVIVGKTGSSKTLAMNIIKHNLSQGTKLTELEKLGFDDIYVYNFQCSKLTKVEGIKLRFEQAKQFQDRVNEKRNKRDGHLSAGVFLDAVGLAEQSPYLPLKALHQLLEEPEVWFVALSNWPLDSAKMNRMVFHNCPQHSETDLIDTAKAIVESYRLTGSNHVLAQSLKRIANIYYKVNDTQPYENFFGFREFYSTVKFLSRKLQVEDLKSRRPRFGLDEGLLLQSILRNFGGMPPDQFINFMAQILSQQMNCSQEALVYYMIDRPAIELVRQNVDEARDLEEEKGSDVQPLSRNVMVLCEFDSAWQMLFDQNVISHGEAQVIFGSKFKKDMDSSRKNFQNINHINNCMETGKIVVLIDLDELYDCLYDMLNQSFIHFEGRMYCRVALGTESVMCKVHPNFKCIVVVSSKEALHGSMLKEKTAFLNRFEKQYLSRKELIGRKFFSVQDELEKAAKRFLSIGQMSFGSLATAFPGFNSETIPSLILSNTELVKKLQEGDDADMNANQETLYRECCERLMHVATPENVIAHNGNGTFSQKHYFEGQKHDDVFSATKFAIESNWFDSGSRLVVITHDIIQAGLVESIAESKEFEFQPRLIDVTDCESESDFSKRLVSFFAEQWSDLLLVQCDLRQSNVKHIMHVKYLVERHHFKYLEEKSNTTPDDNRGNDEKSGDDRTKIFDKHVVLTVHTERQSPKDAQKYDPLKTFPLVFEKNWRTVFVDALLPASHVGVPSIVAMNSNDITALVGEDLTGLVRRSLTRSFTKLTLNEIKHLKLLRQLTSEDYEDDGRFFEVLKTHISAMIVGTGDKQTVVSVVMERLIKDARKLRSRETIGISESFRSEIVGHLDKIGQRCLSLILERLFVNSHIDLYNPENETHAEVWCELFKDTHLLALPAVSIKEIKSDVVQVNHVFTSNFPFSTYLNGFFSTQQQQLQDSYHIQTADLTEEDLVKMDALYLQHHPFSFDFKDLFPDSDFGREMLASYVKDVLFLARLWPLDASEDDIIDPRGNQLDDLRGKQLAEIVSNLILKHAYGVRDGETAYPWDVHCAVWRLKTPIHHLSNILIQLPFKMDDYVNAVDLRIEKDPKGLITDLILLVVQEHLVNLEIRHLCDVVSSIWRDMEYLFEWFFPEKETGVVEKDDDFSDEDEDDAKENGRLKDDILSAWLSIEFTVAFAREVLIPLKVGRQVMNETSDEIRVLKKFNTLETLQRLLTILGSLKPKNPDEELESIYENRCTAIIELFVGKFCWNEYKNPPERELFAVLVGILGGPEVEVGIELDGNDFQLSGKCSRSCKREILNQLWVFDERRTDDETNVDKFVDSLPHKVKDGTRHYCHTLAGQDGDGSISHDVPNLQQHAHPLGASIPSTTTAISIPRLPSTQIAPIPAIVVDDANPLPPKHVSRSFKQKKHFVRKLSGSVPSSHRGASVNVSRIVSPSAVQSVDLGDEIKKDLGAAPRKNPRSAPKSENMQMNFVSGNRFVTMNVGENTTLRELCGQIGCDPSQLAQSTLVLPVSKII